MSRLPESTQRKIIALRDGDGIGRRAIAETLGVTEKQVRVVLEQHDGEQTGITVPFRVLVWDLETTDFSSFIGSLGVAAFIDVTTGKLVYRNWHDFDGSVADRERGLVKWAAEKFASASVLVGVNSLGFDRNFMNGVLVRYDLPMLPPRIHIDLMMVGQHGLKARQGGSSMANLADYFRLPIQKDKPSKHDWRLYMAGDQDACDRITTRCVEDVKVTALLLEKMLPFYMRWRGQ